MAATGIGAGRAADGAAVAAARTCGTHSSGSAGADRAVGDTGVVDANGYPPEPWRLCGQMHVSLWWLPKAQLPQLPTELASTVRPVTAAGFGLVGTAWVDYQRGSVLQYRELLAAVLVRERFRLRASITGIWVDSVASRDGGRELWGIPKDLARLSFGAELTADGIATARILPGFQLPGRWPVRGSVTQLLAGRAKTTPVRGRAGLQLAGTHWRLPADGSLGYLRGRRPWLTVTLHDFEIVFGQEPAR
jgi:hypothetical protein